MPNAKDATQEELGKPKFLLVGPTGSGKTAQILTLPGKTFAYLFDPSSLLTLKGHDIEYEIFLPGKANLAAVSLSRGKGDPVMEEDASEIYTRWAKDADEKIKNNYFDQFENICFDSFTTFSDIVMDRVLKINGRVGKFPQEDDWPAQMTTIANVVKTLITLDKTLLFTAHDEFKQDGVTKRMQNVILLTGRLRVKIPLLFSEIWHMESASTANETKYQAQTRPDKMNPAIRCTLRRSSEKTLDMFEDITIKNWSNPKAYGIGKILGEITT